jgi:hypothetical protein
LSLRVRKVQKKGEVVVPAGGETGVPRCLAEARKLPESSNNFNSSTIYFIIIKKPVKWKYHPQGALYLAPNQLDLCIISIPNIKCKPKINFFLFFSQAARFALNPKSSLNIGP